MCQLFSEYFQSAFLSSTVNQIAQCGTDASEAVSNYTISDIEITPKVLNKLLISLDLTKGAGPDNIPPLFIKKCADVLTQPLVILMKRSLTEGIVPKIWKSAFITPIHKKGNKNDVKNYRPISKLCIFAKVFERIVHTQVYESLSSSLIPEQHGFIKNRSTTSNLLSFINFTTSSMDSGGQVDAIFTDFSKAFDRIDHIILLRKLFSAGIHGNLYRWFTSYIENRSQAVVLNGYSSAWTYVPSGVPQGSLLAPLLFNLFINDIASCFQNSKFLLYADDMKIFKRIYDSSDCLLLQQDLYRFEEYCRLNRLDLNVSKCYSISFTRKTKTIVLKDTLKTNTFKAVNEIRDLGVIHDSKLIYDKHIEDIVNRANRSVGFIKRICTQFSSIKVIKVLYCAYVRSILEYCSQVWNPQYDIYINRLESIQRRFTKYLQFKCKKFDKDYESRCRRHHMLPLRERRTIADIAYLNKIAQNHVDSPHLLSEIKLNVPRLPARHPKYLCVPYSASNYRRNSFFIRTSNSVNKLKGYPEFDLFNTPAHSTRSFITRSWFDVAP